MPEAIRDENTGVTLQVNADGSINTNLYSDGAIISSAAPLPVSMDSDIQIGAVELKDGDTDTRADIESDGTKNALYVQSNDLDIRDLSSAQDDVSVTTVKPDGTNTMPSFDAVGRAGFVKITDGTETVDVVTHEGVNALVTINRGHICADNSTATPLSADAVFTGSSQDITDVAAILICVYSDVASATDGLAVQWSIDNSNWDGSDVFTIPAGVQKTFSFQPVAQYYRVVYTNGGSDQTVFRLQTIVKHVGVKPSSHRIQDAIIDDDDAELVKAVITGKDAAGTFVNFQATSAGNFKVSLEELETVISTNSNSQLKTTQYDSSGNEMPSMDIVGRAGFVQVTDGTNTMPTMDIAARKGFVQLTDGTDSADVVTAADDTTDLDGTNGLVTNSILSCRIDADTVKPLRMDASTHSIQTMSYEHHEIHAGSHFIAQHSAGSQNDGDTINIYIKTPDTEEWGHMLFSWTSSGAAYGRIYEAPTITSNSGTNGQAIYNHNRNSDHTSTMYDNATTPVINKFGIDVTKTGDGTIIFNDFSGAARSSGGVSRGNNEFVLKQNTVYLFEVESDAAGLTLHMELTWYEHTDKD